MRTARLWLLLLLGPAVALGAEPTNATAAPGIEWVPELDAYYTSIGLHVPLTDEPVPDGGEQSELEIYRQLFLDSLHPRLLLLEASAYPMPYLGTYLRSHHEDFYDRAELGDVNLVEAVTAGFQEPWAASIFFGSVMNFVKPGEQRVGTNKGYMGYLFSAGNKHIHRNVLIDDNWYEFEWKLKGERDFKNEDLSWSFRLGAKEHQHPEIADVVYLGIRRNDLDYHAPVLSFLKNSNLELLTEFTQRGGRFVRQEIIIGKNYPFKQERLSLALDIGLIYERAGKYTGSLSDPEHDRLTLVFRPNIQF